MKNALLTGVTFAALAAGPVAAADLAAPVYKSPVVAVAYDWSGFYIGGSVGGAWGSSDFNDSSLSSVVDPFAFVLALGFFPPSQGMSPVSTTVNSRSWTGGIQGGWNYQTGRFVLGTEFEWNWAGLKGSGGGVSSPNAAATAFCIPLAGSPCVGPVGDAFTSHTNWYATATARLGIAHDRWLFYTKVGAAFDHNNYTQNISGTFFPALFPSPFAATGTASDYRAGWTVGIGLEWAFAGNWSAKIEYDYMNFGSRTVTFNNIAVVNSFFPPSLVSSTPLSVNIYQQMSVVKFGINYRFLSSI